MNNFVIGDINSDFPRLLESFQSYFNSIFVNTGEKVVESWTVSETVTPGVKNFVLVPVSGFRRFSIPAMSEDDVIILDAFTEAANCLTTDVVETLQQYNNKIIILSNGTWDKDIFNYELEYEIVEYPYWLISYSTYIASPHSVNYFQLTHDQPTPSKHFNCLLGVSRPERDYLVSQLIERDLVRGNIVSYKGNFTGNGRATWNFTNPHSGLFEGDYHKYKEFELRKPADEDLNLLQKSEWEDYSHFSLAYGRPWSGREHILPTNLFNATEFSLVVETSVFNRNFHPTEKTLRNFLLKQPFVVFSSQYFLRELRNIGFRTFNGIINEEYDSIECPKARCDAILDETVRLCNEHVIKNHKDEIRVICEHNYNLLGQLQPYFASKLQKAIDKFFINTV